MPISRKNKQAIKKQILNKNLGTFNSKKTIVKSDYVNSKKTIIKSDFVKKKKLLEWNFKVNDLVTVKNYNSKEPNIGVIVSDFKYFSAVVEKNCFFVLIGCEVKQIEGSFLRKI